MTDNQLENTIERAWEERESINTKTKGEFRESVEKALSLMDSGAESVASPMGGHKWQVNQWLKKAVLLSFRLNDMGVIPGGPEDVERGTSGWWDKVPSKFDGWGAEDFSSAGFRAVPNCVVCISALFFSFIACFQSLPR